MDKTFLSRCGSSIFKVGGRGDFLFLTVFVISANLPFFNNVYVPAHDTLYCFELFHYFYSQFYFFGQIAHWMAYENFGMPSNFDQILSLSPVSYLMFVVGWLFKIKNALWLFRVTVMIEQLIFLLGMYWLARGLYVRRSTVFIICLSAVCLPDLSSQLYFDFRIYYLLPWAVYFLLLFFQRRKAEYLWLSGITLLVWVTGNVAYFITLWVFLLAVIFAVLFWHDKSVLRCLFEKRWSNFLLLLALTALALSFYCHLKSLLMFADLSPRSASGKTQLLQFLQWGGVHDLAYYMHDQILGNDKSDVASYLGLFAIVFFFWAALQVRNNKIFFALLTVTLALLWFSFGGIFAVVCYYFPGIAFYRHIGLVHGLLKVFVLLCAGFGLEHFWSVGLKQKVGVMSLILVLLVFLVDSLHLTNAWFTALAFSSTPVQDFWAAVRWDSVVLRMSGYALTFLTMMGILLWRTLLSNLASLRPRQGGGSNLMLERLLRHFVPRNDTKYRFLPFFFPEKIIKVLLIGSIILDIGSYQFFAVKQTAMLPEELRTYGSVVDAHRFEFQQWRTKEPVMERQRQAYALTTRPGIGSVYSSVYSFTQYDPCYTQFYWHLSSKGFQRLLKTRHTLDQSLIQMLGCYTPKLRLFDEVVYTDTIENTMKFIMANTDLNEKVVILDVSKEFSLPTENRTSSARHQGTIDVRKFTPNELVADVEVPQGEGAWFVYTDNFHPGWKAKVNGKNVPIYEAYLAFKAVFLQPGQNIVRFSFQSGLTNAISYLIAIFGFLTGSLLLILFMGKLVFNYEPKNISIF